MKYLFSKIVYISYLYQKTLVLFVFIILSLSINCKSDNQKSSIISSVILDERIVDTVSIELSDIAKNIYIVYLEQSSKSMIGNIYNVSVGDNYILIATEREYFIFSGKGDYIKQPFTVGRGPQEVINPLFSTQIKDGKIWLTESNRRNYVQSYDIGNETWQTYKLPSWAKGINVLGIGSDSTISFVNRLMHLYGNVTLEFTYVEQGLNGELKDSLSLGKSSSEYGLSFRLLKDINGGFYAMDPRGDSIIHICEGKYSVIWRNFYEKNRSSGYNEKANLVHFSTDTIILEKSGIVTSGNKTTFGLQPIFVLVDRINDKLSVMDLYYKSKSIKIQPENFILLGDNKFCIWVSPYKIIKEIKMDESLFNNPELSENDNPILIFGEFR